jgi:SAM-dependent methyltransferase
MFPRVTLRRVKHDHITINRANWDSRVPVHLKGYDLARFRADPSFLSAVVRYDLPRLGEVRGQHGVHLQCHIGTDTISLARLGASMCGLDLSPASVEAARALARELGHDIAFVEADVYDAVAALGAGRFDFAYTGIGALCWIPDVRRWAQVVAALLRPGGRLFIRDGHPALYMLSDPRPDGLIAVQFPYFESEGTRYREESTYEGDGTAVASPDMVFFNHGIAEMLDAIRAAGLELESFEEHESVPWNPLGDACERFGEVGEWRMRAGMPRIPMSFTLRARRPG